MSSTGCNVDRHAAVIASNRTLVAAHCSPVGTDDSVQPYRITNTSGASWPIVDIFIVTFVECLSWASQRFYRRCFQVVC